MARATLSDHAVRRSQERIWPALSRGECKERLLALLPYATFAEELDWYAPGPDEATPQYYLELSDGIALAMRKGLALTTLTRSGLGSGAREYRAEKRKQRRRHKREAASHKHGRSGHRYRASLRAEDAG